MQHQDCKIYTAVSNNHIDHVTCNIAVTHCIIICTSVPWTLILRFSNSQHFQILGSSIQTPNWFYIIPRNIHNSHSRGKQTVILIQEQTIGLVSSSALIILFTGHLSSFHFPRPCLESLSFPGAGTSDMFSCSALWLVVRNCSGIPIGYFLLNWRLCHVGMYVNCKSGVCRYYPVSNVRNVQFRLINFCHL